MAKCLALDQSNSVTGMVQIFLYGHRLFRIHDQPSGVAGHPFVTESFECLLIGGS
jgi:hypothetical protein